MRKRSPEELAQVRRWDQRNVEVKHYELEEYTRHQQIWRILPALKQIHNIDKPSHAQLLAIARAVSARFGIVLDHEAKRRKSILIGWLNKNFEAFRETIPKIVLEDSRGHVWGPMKAEYEASAAANPNSLARQFLQEQFHLKDNR
jgi:hypothetical protein